MNKKAKSLCGTDVGALLTFKHIVWDYKYECWKDAIRTSPITMITHKKDGRVNVRVAPSGFHKHSGEAQFEPSDWVEVNRD